MTSNAERLSDDASCERPLYVTTLIPQTVVYRLKTLAKVPTRRGHYLTIMSEMTGLDILLPSTDQAKATHLYSYLMKVGHVTGY